MKTRAPLAPLTLAGVLGLTALPACSGGEASPTSSASSSHAASSASGAGGSGGSGGSSASATSSGGFIPGPHGPLPTVVSSGGPVLAQPKVQAITYPAYAFATQLDGFLAELKSSAYWSATTAEYGVGPLSVRPDLTFDGGPSITDGVLESMLASNLSGSGSAWGDADASTIYLFVFPEGTSVDHFGLCCEDFDGYHSTASVGDADVAYGVVCTCLGPGGAASFDDVSVAASRVLVGAATNPFVFTDRAYGSPGASFEAWAIGTGGEVSDLCRRDVDARVRNPGGQFMVQRMWSNEAALAAKNPCVPAPAGPFFDSVPVLPDDLTLSLGGGTLVTKGVKIAVGESKTIDVQLFSEGELAAPFHVTAYDLKGGFTGGSPDLAVALDETTGRNGDTRKLTITVLKADPTVGGEVFVLASDGPQNNLFYGMVGQ